MNEDNLPELEFDDLPDLEFDKPLLSPSGGLMLHPQTITPIDIVSGGLPNVAMDFIANKSKSLTSPIVEKALGVDRMSETPIFKSRTSPTPIPKSILELAGIQGSEMGQRLGESVSPKSAAKFAVDIATDPRTYLFPFGRKATKPVSALMKMSEPTEQSLNDFIRSTVKSSFNAGIKPTIRGAKTASSLGKYYDKATEGVNTVLDLIDDIKLPDLETGELVSRLPKTVEETANAVGQAKKLLFNSYDRLRYTAGLKSPTINLGEFTPELNEVANSKAIKTVSPSLSTYASEMASRLKDTGKVTLQEAQDMLQELNSKTDAFFKSPDPNTVRNIIVDARLARMLRKKLSSVIESSGGEGYSMLKNKYGALDTIEGDITRRALSHAKIGNRSLLDFTDVLSTGELIRGIASGNLSMILKGTAQWGAKEWMKFIRNPDRIISNMFEKVAKARGRLPAKSVQAEVVQGALPNYSRTVQGIPQSVRRLLPGPYSASGEGFTVKNLSDAELAGLRRQMEFKRNFEMPIGESRGTMNPSQIKYKNIVDEILARRARNFPGK